MFRLGTVARHVQPDGPQMSTQLTMSACDGEPGKRKVWYAPHKFEAYGEEEIKAVEACLRDGWLAPGPRTEEFEKKVAAIFGKKYAVMVNSGSSANIIGLAMLGMEKGDEVVTPALTFSTAVAPILQLGFVPVFCDAVPDRFVPTVEQVLEKITPKTKCILVPNLAGSKLDWKELRARVPKDIVLFEDSCDVITYTEESDISAISFYASHIITAGGMGGMIMMNDEKLRDRALMFRDWGRIGNNSEDMSQRFGHDVDGIEYDFKFLYGVLGYNMKACEMSAAFGLAQLEKFPHFRAKRAANVAHYVKRLTEAKTNYVIPHRVNQNDWLAMPLLHEDRKGVLRYLESNDVQIRVFFAGNITRHPAYRDYLQAFPGADRVMKEGFLIGAHHGLETADVDRVCDLLIEYDRKNGKVTDGSAQASGKGPDSANMDF